MAQQPINRPQEPQYPYPYDAQEVQYENKAAGVVLSGTLTTPRQESFPVVLLIAGYGAHDRDVTGMGHCYFRVLADYLTRQGIGVLRVDKRGVGKSSGDYSAATSQDFASDVLAGIEYLASRKDINASQIGLIGLSEGGLIACMVAAQSTACGFIVLMAPALLNDTYHLIEQASLQLRADGASESFITNDREVRTAVYSIVKQEAEYAKAEKLLHNVIAQYLSGMSDAHRSEAESLPFAFTQAKADALVKAFNSPWYRFFLSCDPVTALKRITVPVLALNGDRDWIVSPEKVFSALRAALEKAGNKDYTLCELPQLNHMFQTCQSGALKEYAAIEETISPVAMGRIAEWIAEKTRV